MDESSTSSNDVPLTKLGTVGAVTGVIVSALLIDIFTPAEYCPPILYVIALTLCVSFRDRRLIAALTLLMLGLTFVGGLFCYPPTNPNTPTTEFWINRAIVAIAIVAISGIIRRHIMLVEAYRRRGEELAVATEELERRRRQAEDASARKTRFLAAISHDIRTPANAIRLLARLIRKVRSDPARVDDLTIRLEANTVALSELLTDALDIARFDSEALMTPNEGDVRLSDVLDYVVGIAQPLADAKRLQLSMEVADGDVSLHADRRRVARVILNLIDNAIKFTDAGGVSLTTTESADGGLRLCVRDTGRGIEPENLASIFDEFVQVRRTDRDRVAGRGLGLATCKRLVTAMDGRLEVDSRVGHGTTFTIVFPASRVRRPELESNIVASGGESPTMAVSNANWS